MKFTIDLGTTQVNAIGMIFTLFHIFLWFSSARFFLFVISNKWKETSLSYGKNGATLAKHYLSLKGITTKIRVNGTSEFGFRSNVLSTDHSYGTTLFDQYDSLYKAEMNNSFWTIGKIFWLTFVLQVSGIVLAYFGPILTIIGLTLVIISYIVSIIFALLFKRVPSVVLKNLEKYLSNEDIKKMKMVSKWYKYYFIFKGLNSSFTFLKITILSIRKVGGYSE